MDERGKLLHRERMRKREPTARCRAMPRDDRSLSSSTRTSARASTFPSILEVFEQRAFRADRDVRLRLLSRLVGKTSTNGPVCDDSRHGTRARSKHAGQSTWILRSLYAADIARMPLRHREKIGFLRGCRRGQRVIDNLRDSTARNALSLKKLSPARAQGRTLDRRG